MHHHVVAATQSFLPTTLGGWAAVMAAIAATFAAGASIVARNKALEIHALVNGRLTQAINVISQELEKIPAAEHSAEAQHLIDENET